MRPRRIRLAAVLLAPIMPGRAPKFCVGSAPPSDSLNLDRDGRWRAEGERVLTQDASLWPRFDKKTTKEKLVSESATREPGNPEP